MPCSSKCGTNTDSVDVIGIFASTIFFSASGSSLKLPMCGVCTSRSGFAWIATSVSRTADRVHDRRQVVLLALGHDELERLELGAVLGRVQHDFQVVVTRFRGVLDTLDRGLARHRGGGLLGQPLARGIRARGIFGRLRAGWAALHRLERGDVEPRSF